MMMVHTKMGSSSVDQENKMKIILGYIEHNDNDNDSFSSDVSSVVSSDDESDDTFEEINSSSSPSSNNGHSMTNERALGDMSDLLQQLPSKRGLSKHYQGKSQSFTSLSQVICLEDLAKPENPLNKKIKSCKSYVGLSRMLPPPTRSASSSKLFTKKISPRASCSSSLSNNRTPTQTNGATNNQTPLFI